MKRRLLAFLLILSIEMLALGTAAQTARNTLFDSKKAQEELEILKGILSTTMQFVARDMRGAEGSKRVVGDVWYPMNMTAFYLHGQGATFIIPTSRFIPALSGVRTVWYQDGQGMQLELQGHQAEMEATAEATRSAGVWVQAPPPPVPPVPPPVPAPGAQAPDNPEKKQEDLRKRLSEAQEKIKKRREEMEQQRQKFLESLGQIKVYLIEALANHGDSMTQVKPNEYINLVLTTDDHSENSKREIISVQKSVITDYKAGRLTMDAFKQKVLQYSE